MIIEKELTDLTSQKQDVFSGFEELRSTEDLEKILILKLNSTKGKIPDALEVVEKFHTSNVDLYTESSGEISTAGLLIAAAGKPKNRKAHYSTIFKLRDDVEEGKKGKTKDPYTSCVLETLGGLGARKNDIEDLCNRLFKQIEK